MKKRMLPCELCGRECSLRSKIKSGDNAGKKACPGCASRNREKKTYKPINKQTEKGRAKRQERREGLGDFFAKAVEGMVPICENCGCAINANYNPHWNIAHILSKSSYPSVSRHPENFLILCSHKDNGNQCHEQFDSSLSRRQAMPVFGKAVQKFVKFKDECLERGKEYSIFEENI